MSSIGYERGAVEAYHLPGRLCLCLSLLSQYRKVCAALYPALSVPSALPVAHKHNALGRLDVRELQGGLIEPESKKSVQEKTLTACIT